jgi:hypothetical protein
LWLLKGSPYDAASFERRLLGVIFEREVWVSSPEDVILSKLLWYRAAPVLDRQFQDALAVYEIQEPLWSTLIWSGGRTRWASQTYSNA